MSRIISNASTLILLARVSLLRVWLAETGQIAVPIEVYHETTMRKDLLDAKLIKKSVDEKLITVLGKDEKRFTFALREFRLDAGEAAAYAAYNTKKHEAIMTDDAELIKLCKLEEIPFVGALGITVALHHKKRIKREMALEKIDQLCKIGCYRK
ncbi:MAG TPA: hypothetical protein VJH88_06040 [Candidatus Nanoarchaeia archaeon]|nr:hypothetical protein [Candidatus Nanoarchaeia archaeon]